MKVIEIKPELAKAKKFDGNKLVEGFVISRMDKTMVIRDLDGNTHLCWADKKEKRSLQSINSPLAIICRVTSPCGKQEVYDSIAEAARAYEVASSTVSRICKLGRPFASGKLEGYRFEKMEAGNVKS